MVEQLPEVLESKPGVISLLHPPDDLGIFSKSSLLLPELVLEMKRGPAETDLVSFLFFLGLLSSSNLSVPLLPTY